MLPKIVTVNEMPFGFMPEKITIDAMPILRRQQEKNNRCHAYLEKAARKEQSMPCLS